MKWLVAGPLACFDCETTGVQVETDRIVTATVGTLQPGTPTWKQSIRSWLINSGVDIPDEATAVHGITTVQAKKHGKEPPGALDIIAHDLARLFLARIPVVGTNVCFDFTILDRELRRHDLPTLDERIGRSIGPIVDVYVIDKWLDPYRKGGRKLTDLCAQYGVKIDGAHDSTFDALAAARVAYRMALLSQYEAFMLASMYADRKRPLDVVDRFVALKDKTAETLHRNQIGWRQEQCDGLRAHFDRKGTKHDGVPGDWPMIPYLSTDEAVLHGL